MLELLGAALLISLMAGEEEAGAPAQLRRVLFELPHRHYTFVIALLRTDVHGTGGKPSDVAGLFNDWEKEEKSRFSSVVPRFTVSPIGQTQAVPATRFTASPNDIINFLEFTVSISGTLESYPERWFWDHANFNEVLADLYDTEQVHGWVVALLDAQGVPLPLGRWNRHEDLLTTRVWSKVGQRGLGVEELESRMLLGAFKHQGDLVRLLWLRHAAKMNWPTVRPGSMRRQRSGWVSP